jgi:hypothetical protein
MSFDGQLILNRYEFTKHPPGSLTFLVKLRHAAASGNNDAGLTAQIRSSTASNLREAASFGMPCGDIHLCISSTGSGNAVMRTGSSPAASHGSQATSVAVWDPARFQRNGETDPAFLRPKRQHRSSGAIGRASDGRLTCGARHRLVFWDPTERGHPALRFVTEGMTVDTPALRGGWEG